MTGRRLFTVVLLLVLTLVVPSAFAVSCIPAAPSSEGCGCQDGGGMSAPPAAGFAVSRSEAVSGNHLRFVPVAPEGSPAVVSSAPPPAKSSPLSIEPAFQAASPSLFLSHCAFLC